jgi:hypothetical protein
MAHTKTWPASQAYNINQYKYIKRRIHNCNVKSLCAHYIKKNELSEASFHFKRKTKLKRKPQDIYNYLSLKSFSLGNCDKSHINTKTGEQLSCIIPEKQESGNKFEGFIFSDTLAFL